MEAVALVPAYEPDERLIGFTDRLHEEEFPQVVVVDDGSGERFRPLFDALAARSFCTVLRHESNRGKGAALKTGFAYIRERMPSVQGVVTADSDGQHDAADCRRLAAALAAGRDALYLGSRDFSHPDVPFFSRLGNRWSMVTFGLLHGQWLPDSQTGLRAFPVSLIPFLLDVPGERFEYEMGVLLAASRRRLPMVPVAIRTIYENGNAGTHYRPLLDTFRINRLVFAEFFRFAGVSLLSFALDRGLSSLFAATLAAVGADRCDMIWTSGFAARVLSAVFNFSMNRTVVFRAQGGLAAAAWRYALLCVAMIVLGDVGVSGLAWAHVPRLVAKFVWGGLLYFVSFRIQSQCIFRSAPVSANLP